MVGAQTERWVETFPNRGLCALCAGLGDGERRLVRRLKGMPTRLGPELRFQLNVADIKKSLGEVDG